MHFSRGVSSRAKVFQPWAEGFSINLDSRKTHSIALASLCRSSRHDDVFRTIFCAFINFRALISAPNVQIESRPFWIQVEGIRDFHTQKRKKKKTIEFEPKCVYFISFSFENFAAINCFIGERSCLSLGARCRLAGVGFHSSRCRFPRNALLNLTPRITQDNTLCSRFSPSPLRIFLHMRCTRSPPYVHAVDKSPSIWRVFCFVNHPERSIFENMQKEDEIVRRTATHERGYQAAEAITCSPTTQSVFVCFRAYIRLCMSRAR